MRFPLLREQIALRDNILAHAFDASRPRRWEHIEHCSERLFQQSAPSSVLASDAAIEEQLGHMMGFGWVEQKPQFSKRLILCYRLSRQGQEAAVQLVLDGHRREHSQERGIQSSSNPQGVPLQLALLLELGSFSAASARALALDLKVPTSSIVGAATQLRKAGLLERTQRKQQDLAVHYRLTTLGLAARRGLQT